MYNAEREVETAAEANRLSIARSLANRKREQRHMLFLWVGTVAMFLALAFVMQNQINQTAASTARQCDERRANALNVTRGYDRLIAIERTQNVLQPARVRTERIAAYEAMKPRIPVCAP